MMSTFVYYQFYVFIATFYGGVIIGLLYDIYKVIRKNFKINRLVSIIQDIFFWSVVTVVAIFILFYSNDGKLRWYTFLGFILGALIYNIFLSNIIEHTLNKIINSIISMIKYLLLKIKLFFNILLKVLMYPYKKLKIFIIKPVVLKMKKILLIPKSKLKKIKNRGKSQNT